VVAAWHRVREPVLVLAIALFTGVLSGAQRWAGLDTPDSSFYASLGVFGRAVTDRAPDPAYYWTRLGNILPTHLLTSGLGVWPGFAVHRMLLLTGIVGACYVALRRFTGIASAVYLTVIISLSTVVLSYLGNPYVTETQMAGTTVVIASALYSTRLAAVTSGVGIGWLAMTHPAGLLMATTVWVVLRIMSRTKLGYLLIAAGSAAVTFAAFWISGRILFPDLNWFDSLISSNAKFVYSNFASANLVWPRDISMIVLFMILITVAIVWVTHRDSFAAQAAFAISASSLAFVMVYSPLQGGVPLESPMYQANLWPPALLALAIAATHAMPDTGWGWKQVTVGIIAVALVLVAGRSTLTMPLALGWALALVVVSVSLFTSYKGMIGAIAGVAILLAGAQVLQNARGDLGLYYLSPYNWAFNANPISDRLHAAVNSQAWLIDHTKDTDQILNWVDGDWVNGDRELYVVAGMQLWGENRMTLEPTLTPDDLVRLNTIKPSVIAMYGQTMDGVLAFWKSIPAVNSPTAPQCYDYAWTPNPASPFHVTQGHTCVTRLSWASS